jgi:hypothetical protein
MNRGKIDAQVFLDTLYDTGLSPRSYSGRGMYGKSCIGIETDEQTDVFTLGFIVGQALCGEDVGHLPPCKTDSMGTDMIVYWPDLAWPESADEED